MRRFLAGALCAHCGDPLGEDEEIIQQTVDEEALTIHARCEVPTMEICDESTSPETDSEEPRKAEGNGEV